VEPDLELLGEAIGGSATSWEPLRTGGYTRSRAWRVMTSDGLVFAKEADDEGSLHMLRHEALVYRDVRGPFLPAFVGYADSGDKALLAVELLESAQWPPSYPEDVSPLFDAVELVAASVVPVELPVQRHRDSRWRRVADGPDPFLGLGLCSREWLTASIDALIDAEEQADFEGDCLVHNDIYAGNVAFTPRGAVLVDWGASVRGSKWIDVEAPAPIPDWAETGSTLREDMAGDLREALRWAAELLELPPLS
jgi:hypothetical protein